jgi:hypothetical protein
MRILLDRVACVRRCLTSLSRMRLAPAPAPTVPAPASCSSDPREETVRLRPEVVSLEQWLDLNA